MQNQPITDYQPPITKITIKKLYFRFDIIPK